MTLKRIGTVSRVSKFEERFWIALVVVIALAFVVGFATVALGWTLEDCVEVDFDHPDCDRYTTTTTGVTTSSTTSSTVPGSTTSTSGSEQSTTTSTTTKADTTTVIVDTTTSTIQECPPGTSHQPPMCVPTTIPFFGTTGVLDTTPVISPPEELPFTGVSDVGLLALAGVSLLVLGFTALRYGRRAE